MQKYKCFNDATIVSVKIIFRVWVKIKLEID